MKILIIGEPENLKEAKEKFGDGHSYDFHEELTDQAQLDKAEVVFDFVIDETPENVEIYSSLELPVFINTVKTTIAELNYIYKVEKNVFGFNGIKTFLNREVIEIASHGKEQSLLRKVASNLQTDYEVIDDRVGMVTPRIVFMIINEAFYTVQEGTSTKEDIDLGMKLGTNYPYGPFEWLEKIGIQDVYEVLEALYEDTKEERYKIAPLLKKEYLTA